MYVLLDNKQIDEAETITSLNGSDLITLTVNGAAKQITFENFARALGVTNVPSSAPKFTGNVNDPGTANIVYGAVYN